MTTPRWRSLVLVPVTIHHVQLLVNNGQHSILELPLVLSINKKNPTSKIIFESLIWKPRRFRAVRMNL